MSRSEMLMRSSRFRREREESWHQLERIVTAVEKDGLRSLTFQEAHDLATLYRQAMTSLSLAREISLDRGLLTYLDALCARAYLSVYAPQESLRGLVSKLLLRGIPGAVRRSGLHILIAFLTMLFGGIAGYLLFLDDPSWYNTIMPGEMAGGRGNHSSREALLSVIYDNGQGALSGLAAFSSVLFSHNTRIAIFIFSLGAFACVPSFVLTFYNGLILGAFFALHVDRGIGYDLFAWLSIHGVTELGAVIIACAGGFQLGFAVLFPGNLTRRDALRKNGHDAVKLALLAAAMLIIAALLEGFLRQLVQEPILRIMIGWGAGLLWLTYFLLAGRGKARNL